MMAESPFTSYTGRAVVTVLFVGFLVSILLIGGFLIVNLGMMSKRPEDRIGERSPSDVGILKTEFWPEAPYEEHVLPAEEEGVDEREAQERRKREKPAA